MPIVSDKLAVGVSGFYQDVEGFIDQANRPEKNVNGAELKGGQATAAVQADRRVQGQAQLHGSEVRVRRRQRRAIQSRDGPAAVRPYKQNTAPGGQPTEIEYELASATLEYQADWATATLASSYQEFAQAAILDLTAFFGPLVDAQVGAPPGTNTVPLDSQISTERWAHEFRLTSANNEHLEWLVGLYYTKEESSNFQEAVGAAERLQPGDPGVPGRLQGEGGVRQPDLLLHAEARCDGRHAVSSNDMGVLFSGTGLLAGPALPRQTVSDDVQTYLFNARYRPSDDLSLYVRVADGYRPASANLPLIDPGDG